VSLSPKEGKAEANGVRYEYIDNGGNYEISRMSCGNERYDVSIDFSPAFPDVACLKDGAEAEGAFCISSGADAGTIGGIYKVNNNSGSIDILMHPSEGWKPNEKKLVVRIIYKVAPVFRTWPKTYEYRASIDLTGGAPEIRSAWKRI
jgi:hypothetical protein